jgi:flavin reductase (DIM6/NTAB) family NADH-FMN oxidoreductase RutF
MTSLDRRAFRDALGCFATGVTIVTTSGADGAPIGFTANSFTSVSLDPPLILFNLNRHAHSLAIFEGCAHFAVNILAEHQIALSSRFAATDGDKWQGVAFAAGTSGCPLLDGAIASLECTRHAVHEGGDHRIFVGRVLAMRMGGAAMPLVFWRGAYRRVGRVLGAPGEQPALDTTSALDSEN